MYGKMANTPMVARLLLQQAQGLVNHSLSVRTAAAAAALCTSVLRGVRPQDDPNDVGLSLSFKGTFGLWLRQQPAARAVPQECQMANK